MVVMVLFLEDEKRVFLKAAQMVEKVVKVVMLLSLVITTIIHYLI
jgi:hypothetical protein